MPRPARRHVPQPQAPKLIRFTMPSARSAIAPAVDRVLAAAGGAGLSADRLHDLAVAVSEALSNAAVHGNRLQPGRDVAVAVEVMDGRGVAVEVQDSGSGFDVTKLADPTDPSRVLIPGGRGVWMMRRLVDRLEYNPAGNRVRLVMERRD